jgi:hypothetical protein
LYLPAGVFRDALSPFRGFLGLLDVPFDGVLDALLSSYVVEGVSYGFVGFDHLPETSSGVLLELGELV